MRLSIINNYETLKLYLDRVDCEIQDSPGDGWDNEEVALDKEGEIKHHEQLRTTETLPRQSGCAIQVNPGDGWDNKEVALDKGEIKHHDTIVNY